MSNRSGETCVKQTEASKRDVDEVMPAIATAADELGINPIDVELIVVAIGPGGFTGLRTSIAMSKMIAYATGAKVIPIETAIVIVQAENNGCGPYLVISCVKRDSFWLSRVDLRDDNWVCTSGLSNSNELDQHTRGVVGVYADEFLPEHARRYFEGQKIPLFTSTPNALTLLEVGIRQEKRGLTVDPHKLLPLYPRGPEAVRKWNARFRTNE